MAVRETEERPIGTLEGTLAVTGLLNMHLPPWALMWGLAFGIYAGLKLLSWVGRPAGRAPLWRHVGYLLVWPGMNAGAFLFTPRTDVVRPGRWEWMAAAVKTVIGLVLVRVAIGLDSACNDVLVGCVGMVGIVMSLHFGLFHLLSCVWRTCGVCATPIMNAPLLATSVADFWSRRWNMAFRDLTSRFVVSPLRRPLGAHGAIAVGFLISGLIHDVVMSLPVGGYGGPTVYFVVQYLATAAERSAMGRRMGLADGVAGRLFAWIAVLAPVPLHRPFVEGVVAPFIGALGAWL